MSRKFFVPEKGAIPAGWLRVGDTIQIGTRSGPGEEIVHGFEPIPGVSNEELHRQFVSRCRWCGSVCHDAASDNQGGSSYRYPCGSAALYQEIRGEAVLTLAVRSDECSEIRDAMRGPWKTGD